MDIFTDVRQLLAEASTDRRSRSVIEVLEAFLKPEYRKILTWLDRNHTRLKEDRGRTSTDQAVRLAKVVAGRKPLSAWERLDGDKRKDRLKKIESLAKQLAKLLSRPDSPRVPPAIELFQPGRVESILGRGLQGATDEALLREQQLAPMLARVALLARREIPQAASARRQARWQTGNAEARALAVELAGWFAGLYDCRGPYEVVASVVNVVMPELKEPFTGDKVRECLGKK